jgi:hypothetical protein
MTPYDAKVFDFSSLPSVAQALLNNYYSGTDRSIPNDSFHPFPLCGGTIEEALDECDSSQSEDYKNLLRWFYQTRTKGRVIIHFNW